MGSNVSVEDYILIETFIKISHSIEELYLKLYQLEKKKEKESAEYHKVLDYLLMTIEYEKSMYGKSKLSILKCQDLINILSSKYLGNKNYCFLDSLIIYPSRDGYIKRTISILSYLMKTSNDEYDETFYRNSIEIYLLQDIMDLMLVLLNEHMTDSKCYDKLLFIKYVLTYTHPFNEEDKLKRKLAFDDKICDSSQLISYIIGVKKEDYIKIKDDILIKLFRKIYYKKSFKLDKMELKILKDCVMRSIIALMEDESLDVINRDVSSIEINKILKIMI